MTSQNVCQNLSFVKVFLWLVERWPEMDVKWPSLCFVLFVSNKSLLAKMALTFAQIIFTRSSERDIKSYEKFMNVLLFQIQLRFNFHFLKYFLTAKKFLDAQMERAHVKHYSIQFSIGSSPNFWQIIFIILPDFWLEL